MRLHVFSLVYNEHIGVELGNNEASVIEVKYLSKLLFELEKDEDINRKEKVRILGEIIHGERDFRHKIAFSVPVEFRDILQVDKSVHLLERQNIKKWDIECLKRDIVLVSPESVQFFQF